MIGIDLDGTLLNYNDHVSQTRANETLLALLRQHAPGESKIVIVTNQGGMAFHALNPQKYPSPVRVAERLRFAVQWLHAHDYRVVEVRVSAYHPRANTGTIKYCASKLRKEVRRLLPDVRCVVHESARSRKPSPVMLCAAKIAVYFGDSPEDMAAAQNAGISGVPVVRFS